MEDSAAPLPKLTGDGDNNAHRGARRWMWFSLISFGAWLVVWSLLIYEIEQNTIDKLPEWAGAILVVAALVLCLLPFAPLYAGLFLFRTREGKVATFVSGLHSLIVLSFTAVGIYAATHKK